IFVTHDQVEAMTLADKLVVMNGGRIEQVGSPAEVYSQPASTFVAEFLGAPAMNLFAATELVPGKLALDMAPYYVLEPGIGAERVTVGIRPEDLVIVDGQGLAVEIDLVEELGGSRVLYASLGGTEISAVVPPRTAIAEGAQIRLGL